MSNQFLFTTWGKKAILHIDGDCFFASIEQAQNIKYQGKAIVTGQERGIVSSMSVQAKQLGITRAMPIHQVKKDFPSVIVVPSDYETYSIYSERMYKIVRRFTPDVEEYGIDECFADITGLRRTLRMTYKEIAAKIQYELTNELGVSFSIGLSSSKVLAKLASKQSKPHGLTYIGSRDIEATLAKTRLDKVWGIGTQTESFLNKMKLYSALDLANVPEQVVNARFAKPVREIWSELRGISVMELDLELGKKKPKSISKTKTFTPPSSNFDFVFAQLVKNLESACIKARRHELGAKRIGIFLKKQDYNYKFAEINLSQPLAFSNMLVNEVRYAFIALFNPKELYRASGIFLLDVVDTSMEQADLFGNYELKEKFKPLYEGIDDLASRYGKHTVHLGAAHMAVSKAAHAGMRSQSPERRDERLQLVGENARRRLIVPVMGSV